MLFFFKNDLHLNVVPTTVNLKIIIEEQRASLHEERDHLSTFRTTQYTYSNDTPHDSYEYVFRSL